MKLIFRSDFYMCIDIDSTWFEGYVVIFEDHLNVCAGTLIGVEAMNA
jgi:hypothetical protein